jgi:predicted CXXCH cytochrome family protein
MKNTLLAISLLFVLLFAARPAAAACTVCHSKNPKMVSMHKSLEYKDCFKCHGPASERKMPNAGDEMTVELLCRACHASRTTIIRK